MVALTFNKVSKRYRIYREHEDSSANFFMRQARRLWSSAEEFWALRDVSFAVEDGEAFGIIGANGAGKSTILKLLYNITTPTRGEIYINGRLSALIEIASGFHPELTGRENAYLNGSLLGMRRAEIAEKLDSIVDFAGVAPFIDTPVKFYSSGMYLRLGFAIAAHLNPDVLLLDEVLAVGDAYFQAKCIERILELKKAGKTIVFVSHNLGAVESLCDRVMLVQKGTILKIGSPREVISEYENLLLDQPSVNPEVLMHVAEDPPAKLISLTFFNLEGRRTTLFSTGYPLRAEVELLVHRRVEDVVVEVYFYSVFGNLHTHFSTELGGRMTLEPGRALVEFFCSEIPLEVAAFNVEMSIKHRGSAFTEHLDYKHGAVINVTRGKAIQGVFHTPHTWRLKAAGEIRSAGMDDEAVENLA